MNSILVVAPHQSIYVVLQNNTRGLKEVVTDLHKVYPVLLSGVMLLS